MHGIVLFIGLTLGLALLVAALALGTSTWRKERAVRRLREELGQEEEVRAVLPALIGDGQRRGVGALALLADRLELRFSGAPPQRVKLKDIRRLNPTLSMRSLARYETAAPTFGLVLKNGDTIDLVVTTADRQALTTLKEALER